MRRENKSQGLLCVISSPSGGGKTTVIRRILERHPTYRYSISATTRPMRPGERDGVDYYFLTEEEFDRYLDQGKFIEWAEVHSFRYGTLKEPIEKMLQEGAVVLLDIDVVGGMSVKRIFPEQSLLIFLKPPSLDTLHKRLLHRGSENQEQIRKRLERLSMEMSYADRYDIQIVNDDLDDTVNQVEMIIEEAKAKLEVS